MKTDRYIRQINLKDFGPEAQQKLKDASVLVVGAGGLGIPVLQYLNAMGVGTLGIVDQDIIALSNLQRQVLYSEQDLGKSKVQVTLEKLKAQNSETQFKRYDTFLVRDNALEIIADFDLLVDASDNFPTRYLINDACVMLKKPFVYGALHGFEGQVSVFNYRNGPTYRCLFPTMPSEQEIPDCNENGVLGVIPGIVGNLQALEVVKILTNKGKVLSGKLLLFNGLNSSFASINLRKIPENLNISSLQKTYGGSNCQTLMEISVKELQKLLDSPKSIQVIDVRSTAEFDAYHLSDTMNIPLENLEERIEEIDTNQPVYFVCQWGKRSQIAQKRVLQKFPDTKVYNVSGGIENYRTVCS